MSQVLTKPVLITQDCCNSGDGCTMKVDTLLSVGAVIPDPRECVMCASERLSAERAA